MRVLLTEGAIRGRVRELGAELTAAYASSPDLVLLGVMKGSFCFLADLAREVRLPLRVELATLRSYEGSEGGDVRVVAGIEGPLAGTDVVVVEDIVDRGATVAHLRQVLANAGANSVRVCALLVRAGTPSAAGADFVGFAIGGEFVVGYGLDLDQRWRNLPFVGVLEPGDDGAGIAAIMRDAEEAP